ncbi:MAG TPA: histidine kinase [Streptosporangiaceae bacterium]
MSALYAWLRRHQLLVDSVLAAVVGLFSIGQLIRGPWAGIPATLLMIVPVAFRRRAPVSAFALAAIGGAIQVTTARPNPSDVAILILLYTVAAYRPRRASIMALLVCMGGTAVAVLEWEPVRGVDLVWRLIFSAFLFGGLELTVWILGDSMRYRRGYYAALEDKAARLEAERHAQAKVAAAAERARIARELHDVVAHHVSVMVVQADGAGYALRADPDRAAAALQAIAGTGRQALTEMRRLLGVLRSADEQTALAPMPGLGELRELLDQARGAGLEVSYTLTGTPRELPEGAELAAYRVVQESLTNTRKHAGLAATAAVALRYEPDGLTVEVTDDGLATSSDDAGGHGLAGMRERIGMYGGTVTAGPLPGGGFGVTARLPCPKAAVQVAGPAPAQLARELLPQVEPAGLESADAEFTHAQPRHAEPTHAESAQPGIAIEEAGAGAGDSPAAGQPVPAGWSPGRVGPSLSGGAR